MQFKPLVFVLATTLMMASCAKENDDVLTDDRDQFTGTWNCSETENSNPPVTVTFQLTISKKGTADTVQVDNFNNLGSGFKAIFLVSGTSVAIPTQSVGGFQVTEGSGFLSGNKISLIYKVDNISYTAECTR